MAVLGEHDKRPVASRDMLVLDPVIGTYRQVVGGKPVPGDLVEVYESESKGSGKAKAKDEDK